MMKTPEVIDAVILWVDGNDPKWQEEKAKYQIGNYQEASDSKYRDWGTLKYLFRGIEKYAPWIRKIHFVTCGHYPKWLDLKCSKLHFVQHKDFIPNEFLPTFSSRSIDLNLHRIEGLSEHFIYFNDDMFLTNYVKPSDFFRNGKPCDILSERPICAGNVVFDHNLLNDMQILSKYFNRKDFKKRNLFKLLNPRYGIIFFYNLIWYFMPFKKFCGLYINHLPMSYQKSTWIKLWELEEQRLTETVQNKFRTITDLNQFIFNFWNLMSGEFAPKNMNRQGKCFQVSSEDNKELYYAIKNNKYKRICINDQCSQKVFENIKDEIINNFEYILPDKSIFER